MSAPVIEISITTLNHLSGDMPLPDEVQAKIVMAVSDVMDDEYPGMGTIQIDIE